jgi:uncharacterized sulfatase
MNLVASHPAKLAELRALLDRHQAAAREPLWMPTTEWPTAIDKTRAERVTPDDEVVYVPN